MRIKTDTWTLNKIVCWVILLAGIPLLSGCRTFQSRSKTVSIHDLMTYDGTKMVHLTKQSVFDPEMGLAERRRLQREFRRYKKQLMMQVALSKVAGRKQEAQRLLDKLIDIDPQNLKAVHLRAELAIEDGQLMLAEKMLKKQIAAQPHYSLCDKLAYIYYLREDFDLAQAWLQRALDLGAPPARIDYHLGMIAEQRREPVLAQKYYEQALSQEPEFKKAAVRLRALQFRPHSVTVLAQDETVPQTSPSGPPPERVQISPSDDPLMQGPDKPKLTKKLKAQLRKLKKFLRTKSSPSPARIKKPDAASDAEETPPARPPEISVPAISSGQSPPPLAVQVLETPKPANIVKIHSSGRFAVMNKGRWDGIAPQQKLYLYRNGAYIGQLRVSRVSSDFATLFPVDNLKWEMLRSETKCFPAPERRNC
jgi:tetratricopeptide (TPR) repeat protein